LGYQAGYSNTTAAQQTFVGHSAGYNSNGNYNIALGYSALYSAASSTARYNVGIGPFTLYSNTTGEFNTVVGGTNDSGTAPLKNNTSGLSNCAFGNSALTSNTTGSYNVSVGFGALAANTTASYNTAVGYFAGYSNTTGTANTYVGIRAGVSATTGTYNTFVGSGTTDGAGAAITTGGKNSIFGGYNGNQGGLDIRTASNYIVLSDGDGNPYIHGQRAGSPVFAQTAVSNITSGSAQTIFVLGPGGSASALVLVTGRDASFNWFNDILNVMQSNSAQTISTQNGGSPGSRTYSMSSTALQLNPSATQVIVRVVVLQNINA
jgi:hypothetical protein